MKTAILSLVLLPSIYAAEWIKLWKTKGEGYLDSEADRCYASVDDNSECTKVCNGEGRHVFFDNQKWWEGAYFGKFTDPRSDADKWLNIWPERHGRTWAVYVQDGDGTKIGLCEMVTHDKACFCGSDADSAVAFAFCKMDV